MHRVFPTETILWIGVPNAVVEGLEFWVEYSIIASVTPVGQADVNWLDQIKDIPGQGLLVGVSTL